MLASCWQELYLCQYRYSLFIANTTEEFLPALLCLGVVYQGLSPRVSCKLVLRLIPR